MKKLTSKTEKLLKEFDEAAKSWGWAEDSGIGETVTNSEIAYIKADAELRKHLFRMERRLRKERENKPSFEIAAEIVNLFGRKDISKKQKKRNLEGLQEMLETMLSIL